MSQPLRCRAALVASALLALGAGALPAAEHAAAQAAPPRAMPVISNDVPVYASSAAADKPAAFANRSYSVADNQAYDTLNNAWQSASAPTAAAAQWIAYDLSAVPADRRTKVDVIWYNASGTYQCCTDPVVGAPKDYVIEGNAAPSGPAAPDAGWSVLAEVGGNGLAIREQVVDMTGLNWIRLRVTATTDGSPVSIIHMDVHDLSRSGGVPEDSWLFLGDSITAGALSYAEVYWHAPTNLTFASVVNSLVPGAWPAQTAGGIGGTGIDDALANIDTWLSTFPGRYVGLAYGTNDSRAPNGTPERFFTGYDEVVSKVIAAGKVPIVPLIPWTSEPTYNPGASPTDGGAGRIVAFNQQLLKLYARHPEIVKGPDFYRFFFDHQPLLNGGVHPAADGYGQMRQIWACQAARSIYHAPDVASSEVCAAYRPYLL